MLIAGQGFQVTQVPGPPTAITSVLSSAVNGIYGGSATLLLSVMFNNPVTVTGSPQLALNSGGTASYAWGGALKSSLTCVPGHGVS